MENLASTKTLLSRLLPQQKRRQELQLPYTIRR